MNNFLNFLLSFLVASNVSPSIPINFTANSHTQKHVEDFVPEVGTKIITSDSGEPLFLTPFIENGDIVKARSLSRVGKLPNANDVPSYSGFFTVNKQYNSNMFFWFFPALNKDIKAPIILWLQGGPGASDLFGLFLLHGPYVVRKNLTVDSREHTWAKEFNVIYVDNPVGTGFSFTNDDEGYSKDEDQVADNLYEFLQQFFKVFYEYSSNDLYVMGESYGGKYVPAIAYKMHVSGPPAKIKFKGIAIGNGLSDPENQMNYSDFFYQLGIVDSEQADIIRNVSEKCVESIRNGNFEEAYYYFNNIVADVPEKANPNYILEFGGYNYPYNLLQTQQPEDQSYYTNYLQIPEFRKAVHVGNLTFHSADKVREHMLSDIMKSIKQKLATLMDNYKVMIYNGQLDLTLPYVLMSDLLSKLRWKSSDQYKNAERKIWKLDAKDKIAGYVKTIGDFHQVLVRDAGHMVPYDQPEFGLDMITRFIKNKPFAHDNKAKKNVASFHSLNFFFLMSNIAILFLLAYSFNA